MADAKAKEATEITGEERPPISLNAAWATIKKNIRDPPKSHNRIGATYEGYSKRRDTEEITNRGYQVLLARLRSDHHPALRGYLHHLDPDVDPTCPKCCLADQTLEHWLLDCPGTSAMKFELFGMYEGNLGWLSSPPTRDPSPG